MKILITGASGFVGGHIGQALEKKGHELIALSRNKNKEMSFACEVVDPKGLSEVLGVEAVVHLAGASIADQRWSAGYKKVMRDSRVAFTKNLFVNLDQSKLKVLIQASATGYYQTGQGIITEESVKGNGFLSDLVKDWEEASKELTCRKAYMRIAMILGKKAPAVNKMKPLFENRVGAVLGSGSQYMSWVHIDDVVNGFLRALEDESLEGVYNLVSPNPVSNKDFTSAFSEVLNKKVLLPPAPAFALKLLYGEMSSVLLDSHRAVPKRLKKVGFEFKYEKVKKALENS